MRRILVVGNCGSGKSTLSRALGTRLGRPVIHLDRLFWRPGWKEASSEDFDSALRDALAGDTWIIDGNFSRTLPLRLQRADTAIWLDLPRLLCVARVVRRVITHRGRARSDLQEGCPERFDPAFLHWVWAYPTRNRSRVATLLDEFERRGNRVIRLRSPREVREWLANLTSSPS